MENTFFQDAAGKPFMPIGLQVHNSSTGSNMIKKSHTGGESIWGETVWRLPFTGAAWNRNRIGMIWSW